MQRARLSATMCRLLGLALLPVAAFADSEVLFKENFSILSKSQFEHHANATQWFGQVYLRGSALSSNITSNAIDVSGYNNLVLTYKRRTSGLEVNDFGKASVSIDGAPFSGVEEVRKGDSGTVSIPLTGPNDKAKSIRLRFALHGNDILESFIVDDIKLEGDKVITPPQNADLPDSGDFVAFESGHVRPMALSSDGNRLYLVNTPDNRVEIFDVSGTTPVNIGNVRVGLEPVALALKNDSELWVVNHLSDSLSIVDLSGAAPVVVRTLLVGDEPRDILFAGKNNQWAFITAAHRGQNVPFDPQQTTPGIGRSDIWVFDAADQGKQLGGAPLTILNMFGDTLRALARNADGTKVYGAVFNSGNRTSAIAADILNDGVAKPPPFASADGVTQPRTGMIVKYNGKHWLDNGDPITGEVPRIWNDRMNIELPDYDVFTIDTSGAMPKAVANTSGVGTTLFNMAVNPKSGTLYVSNQEALNLTRFEGPGLNATTVRGHFVENRISVVKNGTVQPRHLNKHINYNTELGTPAEKEKSLAIPLQMQVSADGETLYLATMGSSKLARFNTQALESGSFQPTTVDQLVLSGGGATGVVLDEARQRAFVSTRFDNGLSVVSLGSTLTETAHLTVPNPEPEFIVKGRKFLYDATYTSSRGDSSCAGCHIFGDMDHLSWDLGNPDATVKANPNRYNAQIPKIGRIDQIHPMKGPMSTQSLRGLANNGPMHWRGDRTGEGRDPDETLEEEAFEEFNGAFVDLVGRATELTEQEMDSFAKFALALTYPPNPNANLDNSLTTVQSEALHIYDNVVADIISTCNGCHVLDPVNGHFGTDGSMSIEGPEVDEDVKIPHLRNIYQKVGLFGTNSLQEDAVYLGPQIRGFGFGRVGIAGTTHDFLSTLVFIGVNDDDVTKLEQFVLAYPSNMNPVVGQQVTLTTDNQHQADIRDRAWLLYERALVTTPRPECDLVASSVVNNQAVAWVMNLNGEFASDDGSAALPVPALLNTTLGKGAPLTLTCTPPGRGVQMAVDRDLNGVRDRSL